MDSTLQFKKIIKKLTQKQLNYIKLSTSELGQSNKELDLLKPFFNYNIYYKRNIMKKNKKSNLEFTIEVKDFTTNKDVVDYLIEAINTSLELNIDEDFNMRMKQVDEFELSLKNNLKIKIKDCGCAKV